MAVCHAMLPSLACSVGHLLSMPCCPFFMHAGTCTLPAEPNDPLCASANDCIANAQEARLDAACRRLLLELERVSAVHAARTRAATCQQASTSTHSTTGPAPTLVGRYTKTAGATSVGAPASRVSPPAHASLFQKMPDSLLLLHTEELLAAAHAFLELAHASKWHAVPGCVPDSCWSRIIESHLPQAINEVLRILRVPRAPGAGIGPATAPATSPVGHSRRGTNASEAGDRDGAATPTLNTPVFDLGQYSARSGSHSGPPSPSKHPTGPSPSGTYSPHSPHRVQQAAATPRSPRDGPTSPQRQQLPSFQVAVGTRPDAIGVQLVHEALLAVCGTFVAAVHAGCVPPAEARVLLQQLVAPGGSSGFICLMSDMLGALLQVCRWQYDRLTCCGAKQTPD